MNTELLAFALIAVSLAALLQSLAVWFCIRRRATPRDPNPEPGPLKTGGLPGLHEERREILRRLKREHVELQMLDPDDDDFSEEYEERIDRKHNLHQQLFAVDMMLKGSGR